ncbi:unnamed protein product [Absidia cylindrospora]
MDGNRQALLQQSSSYTIYLPFFSLGIIAFYVGVYILRYFFWRVRQRRRKVRLLEYEKLRWVWHQKQLQLGYQTKEEKKNTDFDGEQDSDKDKKQLYSRSSSSLSVTTINEHVNENFTKTKAKKNQKQYLQNKCDYGSNGDDNSLCREPSLVLTIPSPAYQPSHEYYSHPTPKPRLLNQKTTQLHHHHQHQSSSSSSASSSSTRKASSHGHQGSFYSSSSSTTTLASSCIQQYRGKKENNPDIIPCLTSSPTTLSFSSPTSPSSSLKETCDLFYNNQEKEEKTDSKDRPNTHSFVSLYDKKDSSSSFVKPTQPKPAKSSSSSPHTTWSFYDTKAKRTRMIWKWSVAMGYCHYDHAKMITSIIDQLDRPPSHGVC